VTPVRNNITTAKLALGNACHSYPSVTTLAKAFADPKRGTQAMAGQQRAKCCGSREEEGGIIVRQTYDCRGRE
jgi:hypothetical protein